MLLKRLQKICLFSHKSFDTKSNIIRGNQATQHTAKEDAVLQKLVELICNSNWTSVKKDDKFSDMEKDELALFSKVLDELMVTNDIVLRETHIVVPRAMRQQILALTHQGHQGIVKTK